MTEQKSLPEGLVSQAPPKQGRAPQRVCVGGRAGWCESVALQRRQPRLAGTRLTGIGVRILLGLFALPRFAFLDRRFGRRRSGGSRWCGSGSRLFGLGRQGRLRRSGGKRDRGEKVCK